MNFTMQSRTLNYPKLFSKELYETQKQDFPKVINIEQDFTCPALFGQPPLDED